MKQPLETLVNKPDQRIERKWQGLAHDPGNKFLPHKNKEDFDLAKAGL